MPRQKREAVSTWVCPKACRQSPYHHPIKGAQEVWHRCHTDGKPRAMKEQK